MPKLSDMKMPSPSDLAFWKKESDSAPPPPPSRHLNPAMTEGSSLASQNTDQDRSDIDIDDYRRKIDAMKDGIASAEKELGGSKKPLRKPYGGESTFGDSSFGSNSFGNSAGTFKSDFKADLAAAGNSIDQGFASAKEKASTFGSNSLSDAQQRFNDAVADTKKPFGNGDFRAPADVLSTAPSNEFKNALARTNSQLQTGIDNARKSAGLDSAAAKVNQSLYDMNGQLTTGGTNASKAIGNSVDAARQRFSNVMGTVSDRAIEAAKTSKDFGGGLKDKIVSAASEFKPPLRGEDNGFKPKFTRASDPVAAEAQELLNKAKDRVAGLGTGFDFPGAQNQEPKFGSPSNTSGASGGFAAATPSQPAQTAQPTASFGGTFNQPRIANVTPVATPSQSGSGFGQRSGIDSSLTNSWHNGTTQSQLKPIEIGTPSSTPGNNLRTAAVQNSDLGSSSSVSNIPAAFDAGRNAMTSHVSEIDIPAKILSGSGSYAPGSVNKVR
ncbi:hypothetical protein [Mariniblastus fucicola]|nr:hypothetical protein [Mariniblastus fucicola]